MSVFDWILLGFAALAGVRGYLQGFAKELGGVAAPLAGLAAAVFLYDWGAGILRTRLKFNFMPEVVACIILFVVAFAIVKIVANILHEALEAAHLGLIDRWAGAALGLAEGFVVVAAVLLALQLQHFFDVKSLLGNSVFAKNILPILGPEFDKAMKSIGGGTVKHGTLPVSVPVKKP
ncbi:MAG: CvpA family protein [Spirochaetota bacterium]